MGKSKYNARRVTVDGLSFDSEAEARRYAELKLLQAAGAIGDLMLRPRFELQAAFEDRDGRRWASIVYEADFAYHEPGAAALVVEEVKGFETEAWKLKRKLFMARYPEHALRVLPANGRKRG